MSIFSTLLDAIGESWKELWKAKLRTLLAISSIVIGVFGISLVISIQEVMNTQIRQGRGADWLEVIIPAESLSLRPERRLRLKRSYITVEDAKIIEGKCASIDRVVIDGNFGYRTLKHGHTVTQASVNFSNATRENEFLIDPESTRLESGRYFNQSDIERGERVAIISKKTETALFNKKTQDNAMLRIDGIQFKVIGVQSLDVSQFTEQKVIIPYTCAKDFLIEDRSYWTIYVHPKKGEKRKAIQKINGIMQRRLGAATGRFVDNANPLFVARDRQLFQFLGIMGFLVIISGGVSLSNKMYMDVVERLHEIAVRRALGASIFQIRTSILLEGVLACLVGSIVGGGIAWTLIVYISAEERRQLGLQLDFPFLLLSTICIITTGLGITAALLASSVGTTADPAETLGKKDIA
ncbi:MAG: ABC transporter permease [Dehalococcoidia bacterium]|jgi:putative ABC transport system permease protein|nr:MAG: ABC transporter permease [Dehalococcoidia bacterium]